MKNCRTMTDMSTKSVYCRGQSPHTRANQGKRTASTFGSAWTLTSVSENMLAKIYHSGATVPKKGRLYTCNICKSTQKTWSGITIGKLPPPPPVCVYNMEVSNTYCHNPGQSRVIQPGVVLLYWKIPPPYYISLQYRATQNYITTIQSRAE